MTLGIQGIGTAVPPHRFDQSIAKGLARTLCCESPEDETWLSSMYDNTGIRQRHQVVGRALIRDVLEGTTESGSIFLPKDADDVTGPSTGARMDFYASEAPALALESSREALVSAQLDPDEITHLVTVSCTGFGAPGVDIDLIEQLELRPTTQRTHVGFMGCHGALNGLRVVRGLVASEPDACVLLCAVELCSIHYAYGWNPQQVVGNALFADGSASLVCRAASESAPMPWRVLASGSCLVPNTRQAMGWTVGDHGFSMTLSKEIPRIIEAKLRPWLTSWLDTRGLDLDAIRHWAIHPGGPKILEVAEQALGLTRDDVWASHEIFEQNGNMSSPTVLFVLDKLRQRAEPGPCVALGFGPGLTIEVALLDRVV